MGRRSGLSSKRRGPPKSKGARQKRVTTLLPREAPAVRQKRAATSDALEGVQVSEVDRRICIKCAWVAAGRPGAASWSGRDGLAARILQDNAGLFRGRNAVQNVIMPTLRACSVANDTGRDYSGARQAGSGGSNAKFRVVDAPHDEALAVGMAALNRGLSMPRAAQRASVVRVREGGSEVGPNALRRMRGALGGKREAMPRSCQGSRDAADSRFGGHH